MTETKTNGHAFYEDDAPTSPSAIVDFIKAGRAWTPEVIDALAALETTTPEFQAALDAAAEQGIRLRDYRAKIADRKRELAAARAPKSAPTRYAHGTSSGTDLANAEAFAHAHAGQVLHVRATHGWHAWDGRRWVPDFAAVERLAKGVSRSLLLRAVEQEDGGAIKDARRAQGAMGLKSMLALAASEAGIARSPDDFDRDPMLLNVLNGTVDLRTGELRPHRREDQITHLCPVAYDPKAVSGVWDEFLKFSTAENVDLASFLQRCVGYSLTGRTDEEKLFLVHGAENTGKSTFIGAVKSTLGGLAKTADFAAFIEQRFGKSSGGPSEDIARLAGARLVASIEVEEGARLAHALVKHVTGKETITARFLNQNSFEFLPQFKLWLVCNAAPRMDHGDGAIWRRVLRIPLDRVVPLERRDPRVKAHLIGDKGAPGPGGAAVLAWAVRGCLDWQSKGLGVPDIVRDATDALRNENDPLRQFLAARCIVCPGDREWHWVLKSEIRRAYEEWCKSVGQKFPVGPRPFAASLRGRQCTEGSKRTKDGVQDAWYGVRLRNSMDGNTEYTQEAN